MPEYFIGLMSGTSLDGVDGVIADLSATAPVLVLASASLPFEADFKAALLALNTPGENELHRAALAANQLAETYAQVIELLLASAAASGIQRQDIVGIGAHGQTVRHRPQEFGVGYTLQLNNPALLAERTGIDVVADFRTADVAAGGQGAPLVPAFHAAIWGDSRRARAVLNIGGISNITLLHADGAVQGFDCGPGNALMDFWCQRHTGQPYDDAGAWAASGQVNAALLAQLLSSPYFARLPPKSTGRDLFNPTWLEQQLGGFGALPAADVQASLTALTAQACAGDLRHYLPLATELLVCGGGALNTELMRQIRLALPDVQVSSTQDHGLPPLQVEATAFAWLAQAFVHNKPGNVVAVTGAKDPRVLGALYKAPMQKGP
ncbi:MAG: anhydro-N-acetylmuramic acid kinase [Polaromonas sp.]|nr:anhydro-N-acetylmuramic acid kinase [Polaromonas sp.]